LKCPPEQEGEMLSLNFSEYPDVYVNSVMLASAIISEISETLCYVFVVAVSIIVAFVAE